jgi:YrbI family 3-deoxy-D-manno-octulosonate 8-phosphate phosphatase
VPTSSDTRGISGQIVNSAVALIPARGGSKSIPRKNVRLLAGKPLIAHTIESARQAYRVRRVIVSTDDPEIAAVSEHYGAEVVWRPTELSGDAASSETALLHVLEYLQLTEGNLPDLVVFLQCTSPLTLPEDIEGTIQALVDEDADSAFATTPFRYFLWQKSEEGDAVGINHDKRERLLRQQREPQFLETGAVYVMRTPGFLKAKHRFFGKTAMYVMPQERCLEIDEPVDLQIAEMLMQKRAQQQKRQLLPHPIAALVLDFDGVFTDNKVIVFQDGREAVICDRSDGWGLAQLKKMGLSIVVLSTEANPVVQERCNKLGLACLQNIRDKRSALMAWLQAHRIERSQVVYVGNDVNDLDCLQAVGCGIVVRDAHPEAQAAARIILSAPGGHGAIREVVELVEQSLKERKDAGCHENR